MPRHEFRKALRKRQQLVADISVQLATIGIRRKLQTRRFTVLRGVTAALRRRPTAALTSIFVPPAVLRSAAPTSFWLTVGGVLPCRPLLDRATLRHSAPALATGAVRIPGRIRSG